MHKANPDPNLPYFTPVPLLRVRANGWTTDAQYAFIAALSQCGVVGTAARSVGRSPRSAWALRKRAGAESFAHAWDAALDMGLSLMRHRALQILNGKREKPLYRHGRQVGLRIVPDHRLMLAALRAHFAERDGLANRMPHRARLLLHDLEDLMADPTRDPRFDVGALRLPWFDWSSVVRGRDAVEAACREARLLEAVVETVPDPEDRMDLLALYYNARHNVSS